MQMEVFYMVFPSPIGLIGVASTQNGLCRVKTALANESDFKDSLKADFGRNPIKNARNLTTAKGQLEMYFAGKLKNFTCNLDMGGGTDFQQQVWGKLLNIPYGKTWSYKCLSGAVKRPKAHRAVGNANGKNPLSIIVPCHRVIRKNGDLGGYASGPHIKQFLLDLEKRNHASL